MRLTVKLCTFIGGAFLASTVLAASDVVVEEAWVRALPPNQTNTAAYMTIRNARSEAIVVVGGSSEIAQALEVHHTLEVDGMMRMEQLNELRIAAGEQVSLSPGGIHLMLLGLSSMPAPGDEVSLCLQLASGEEVCTVAPARKSTSSNNAHEHHHH